MLRNTTFPQWPHHCVGPVLRPRCGRDRSICVLRLSYPQIARGAVMWFRTGHLLCWQGSDSRQHMSQLAPGNAGFPAFDRFQQFLFCSEPIKLGRSDGTPALLPKCVGKARDFLLHRCFGRLRLRSACRSSGFSHIAFGLSLSRPWFGCHRCTHNCVLLQN